MRRSICCLLILTSSVLLMGFQRCFPHCSKSGLSCINGQLHFQAQHGPGYHQSLYILRNTSGRTVYINHPRQQHAVSAGWHSFIEPHHVSAFSLDEPRFDMICSIRRSFGWLDLNNYQCVPCQKYLQVCRVPNAQFTVGDEGTFWLAENYASTRRLAHKLRLWGLNW